MKRFTFALAALAAFAARPALADEPTMAPLLKPPAEITSVQAFGDANTACAEWSNGCAICKRDESGNFACSTPGIACQPKAAACSRQVEKKP